MNSITLLLGSGCSGVKRNMRFNRLQVPSSLSKCQCIAKSCFVSSGLLRCMQPMQLLIGCFFGAQLRDLNVQEAWLLGEDFNNVLRPKEREGGSTPQVQEYGPFAECLEDCGVEDMRSIGRIFTWTNGTIRSKIDSTLVNTHDVVMFPQVEAVFLAVRLSDHSP